MNDSEKEYRPWEPSEAPLLFVVRRKLDSERSALVARFNDPYVEIDGHGRCTLQNALRDLVRLTEDGSPRPCGIPV